MNQVFTKILLTLSLTASAATAQPAEHIGKGTVNGHEFPIAVIRSPGDETEFLATLRKRFGSTWQITKFPGGVFGYGTQFLVKPFADKDLSNLPVRPESAALELFVLEHSMTFSLLEINGERLAVGTPLSVFMKAVPQPVPADSEYGHLRHIVKDAVRISFDFGHASVSSLVGTLSLPAQDAKVAIREGFTKEGMLPADPGVEKAASAVHELFSDGKTRFGNFLLLNKPDSNEVQVNVNQVKIR